MEAENADGPPKYVDLVEALDKLRRRFSFTASLSNNFALKKKKKDKYNSLVSVTAMHYLQF